MVKESRLSSPSLGSSRPAYLSARSRQNRTKSGLCGFRRDRGPGSRWEGEGGGRQEGGRESKGGGEGRKEDGEGGEKVLVTAKSRTDTQKDTRTLKRVSPGKAASPEDESSLATSICRISTTQGWPYLGELSKT